MTKVSCSILSSELKPNYIVKEVCNLPVDYIHLDIMDGKFVENKTWTFSEIKKILSITNKKIDTHFMVSNPVKYLNDYATLNLEYFTFHYEAVKDITDTIDQIKSYGLKVGIAVSPKTDVKLLFPYLHDIDLILIMSVEPGKSGQNFIEITPDKIKMIKDEIINQNVKTLIEVDGGINDETGRMCVEAGVDILVSASYIHQDFRNNISTLKNL